MKNRKTAVLLLNVGTPDAPTVKAVRRYLSEFLNDKRVIDLPFMIRKLLVNLIIVPFRAPKSARLYQRLWTTEGSPLLYISERVQAALQQKLDSRADVFLSMRYGNPSIDKALASIQQTGYERLIVLPLFPQYASSTSETALQAVLTRMQNWKQKPEVQLIKQFYDHPAFLDALTGHIRAAQPEKYDHVVFSFHGLPNRHLDKNHPSHSFRTCTCKDSMPEHGEFCYKATCFQTARQLVMCLGLTSGQYSVSFQSRLSKNWMTPFTDQTLVKLAQQGVKKVLVVAPSFVMDCLETTIEIGEEYRELFIANGGENLRLVEGLNDSSQWISALEKIVGECD